MLYVFLEGPDDERFFSKVMAALLGECHYVLYANMPNSKVNNYIKSIDSLMIFTQAVYEKAYSAVS